MTTIWRAAVIGVAVMLGARGVAAQCCGDCNGDGEVSVNELVSAVNRALNGCQEDGICLQPGGQRFPASGQTTSYGPGSDGDVRAGAVLSYTDNGDGTITDNNTGLMWEKKDDSSGIHGKGNTYTWGMEAPPYTMNGTMVTQFLAALNRAPCFATHCDWRIPNVKELQSIVDYEIKMVIAPAVPAAFHNAAGCTGCTDVRVASCTCTASSFYWSSTTFQDFPSSAWFVSFYGTDFVGVNGKSSGDVGVRAVRGPLVIPSVVIR